MPTYGIPEPRNFWPLLLPLNTQRGIAHKTAYDLVFR